MRRHEAGRLAGGSWARAHTDWGGRLNADMHMASALCVYESMSGAAVSASSTARSCCVLLKEYTADGDAPVMGTFFVCSLRSLSLAFLYFDSVIFGVVILIETLHEPRRVRGGAAGARPRSTHERERPAFIFYFLCLAPRARAPRPAARTRRDKTRRARFRSCAPTFWELVEPGAGGEGAHDRNSDRPVMSCCEHISYVYVSKKRK